MAIDCRAAAFALLIVVGSAPRVSYSQYLFLDANGNGQSDPGDRLGKPGEQTRLDVWLRTDHGRDGQSATPTDNTRQLSLFSYELALAVKGGKVSWGRYTNLQPTMYVSFGQSSSESEFYVGFGGRDILPPGEYKLGALDVQVLDGDPRISFVPVSTIHHGMTSFGSINRGFDGDNTLKLSAGASIGDWADADGIASSAKDEPQQGAAASFDSRPTFSLRVGRDHGGDARFAMVTTRAGYVRIRLFNTSGRLVRTLVDEPKVERGEHAYALRRGESGTRRLPSGVYLYRVETPEAVRNGKVMLVR